MHIPDGFLPPQVCLAGYALTGGVTWYCLRQIKSDRYTQANIPKASLLTAAFFVGSSINLPLPPASVHLVLNGLLGALLGWYAWPAIFKRSELGYWDSLARCILEIVKSD